MRECFETPSRDLGKFKETKKGAVWLLFARYFARFQNEVWRNHGNCSVQQPWQIGQVSNGQQYNFNSAVVQQPWQIGQVSNLWVQIPRLNRDYLFQRTANLPGLLVSATRPVVFSIGLSDLRKRLFPPRRRYGSIIANSHSNANIRKGCSPSNRWTAFLCITISDRESHVLVASYFLCMDLRSFPKRHKSQPTMVALYASSHNAQPHRMQDAFARSAHDAGHVS